MKAALVSAFGSAPTYVDFTEPVAGEDEVVIHVSHVGISQLVRSQASGRHYSSGDILPFIPGNDGVGRLPDGTRVYFVASRAPYGSLAEFTVARNKAIIPIPSDLSDEKASAAANPGMSSSAALQFRAKLVAGESVLVYGATGAAGKLAVSIAKHLGAGKVIAAGRDAGVLESLLDSGADAIISLAGTDESISGSLKQTIGGGVDIVLDYLWGPPASLLLQALEGKGSPTGEPRVRYVQIGSIAGGSIPFPAHILRSSGLELIGSGLGSVAYSDLLTSIQTVFKAYSSGGLQIDTEVAPLSDIEDAWDRATSGRLVIQI